MKVFIKKSNTLLKYETIFMPILKVTLLFLKSIGNVDIFQSDNW